MPLYGSPPNFRSWANAGLDFPSRVMLSCRQRCGKRCPPISRILTGVAEPKFRCALGIAWLVALVTAWVVGCVLTARAAPPVPARGEWPTYGGTHANA